MTYEQALEWNAKLQNSDVSIPQIPDKNIKEDYLFLCEMALKIAIREAKFNEILSHITLPELTWQQRFQAEHRETKERYEKLHRMVTKYEAGTLDFTPNCPIELLKQQKHHMGEYLHDLEIRAEIEGVNLYD